MATFDEAIDEYQAAREGCRKARSVFDLAVKEVEEASKRAKLARRDLDRAAKRLVVAANGLAPELSKEIRSDIAGLGFALQEGEAPEAPSEEAPPPEAPDTEPLPVVAPEG
jgi:hypothetical protein